MATPALKGLTEEEYLAIERAAELKSEFFDGEMFAMAGASPPHVLITSNVTRELGNQLRHRPCRVYPSDLRVKVRKTGLYTYPNVVVVCGEQRFNDLKKYTLLNPTLIIEVLSSTTEAYDRGEKFEHYRQLESLKEYVLIAQDRHRVEWYLRQAQGKEWVLTVESDPQGIVPLSSIGCELHLEEVYDKVEFPEDAGRLRRGQGV
jgi:Uma2 family endonuclease